MQHQVFVEFSEPVRSLKVDSCQLPTPSSDEIAKMVEDAYQKGVAAGIAKSKQQVETSQAELASIRDQVIPTLQKEIDGVLSELEQDLPRLIIKIVKSLISSIEWREEDVLSVLRSTIEEISSPGEALTVYLSPPDLKLINTADETVLGKPLEIIWKEDSSLARGDCIVRSRFGIIDAQMNTKLNKIQSQLE